MDWAAERVYAAERIVRQGYLYERKNLHSIRRWVDSIVQSPWFVERYKHIKNITVNSTKERPYCQVSLCKIYLPQWTKNEPLIVIHELAHLCSVEHEHNEFFARTHLALTRRFLSIKEHNLLKQAFIQFGVLKE